MELYPNADGPGSRHQAVIPNAKTGTVSSAIAHIICAVIGAGVLALPYSVAWVGWIAGPILILTFFGVALFSALLLASCYNIDGKEFGHYHHLCRHLLGKYSAIGCSVAQMSNMILTTLAYTITAGISMMEIAEISCSYAGKDVSSSDCFSQETGGEWKLTLLFGAVLLPFCALIPSLEEAWWTSIVGTIGSFTYGGIALIISLANSGNGLGTVGGISDVSTVDKVFGVFNALGSIAFSFNYMLILLEIQDTLKQPPSAVTQMKKATVISTVTTVSLYLAVALSGYAAFGNNVQDNIMTSFTGPRWALLIANIGVLLHMLTAFLVYALPVFDAYESWLKLWYLKRAYKKAGESDKPSGDTNESTNSKAAIENDKAEDGLVASREETGHLRPLESPSHSNNTDHDQNRDHAIHHYGSDAVGFNHTELAPLTERLSSLNLDVHFSNLRHRGTGTHDSGQMEPHRHSMDILHLSSNMYLASIGLAVEDVPLNTDGVLIPWHVRIPLRILYCLIIIIIAVIIPTFSSIVGLVGALTFFPLSVHFPIACYKAAYSKTLENSSRLRIILAVIWWCMGVVAIVATVGAVRTMVQGFENTTLFGT